MHLKFDIQNERLEWYKKLSIFAKWVMRKNSDALAATYKSKITQFEWILSHSF